LYPYQFDVFTRYAQPVNTGMPGFQLVDIQPPQQLPSPSKTIDLPFFDAKHPRAASHTALVAEAKSVDKELKRIEQHVRTSSSPITFL
jgi:hypothetical protein